MIDLYYCRMNKFMFPARKMNSLMNWRAREKFNWAIESQSFMTWLWLLRLAKECQSRQTRNGVTIKHDCERYYRSIECIQLCLINIDVNILALLAAFSIHSFSVTWNLLIMTCHYYNFSLSLFFHFMHITFIMNGR